LDAFEQIELVGSLKPKMNKTKIYSILKCIQGGCHLQSIEENDGLKRHVRCQGIQSMYHTGLQPLLGVLQHLPKLP